MLNSIIIYAFTIFVTVLFSWVYQKKANTTFKKVIGFILIIIVPVLVGGLRNDVGIDFKTYESYYYLCERLYISGNIFSSDIEIGYVLLNVLAKIIFNNAQGIFILSSLVFVSFAVGGIIKYKDKISMPIATLIFMTFFYSAFFNITRQAISAIIIFYAISYAMDRKFLKYIFFVFLAASFHKSALICILFYFLVPSSEKKVRNRDLVFNCSIIIFIIILPVFRTVIENICAYFNFYDGYFLTDGVKNLNFLLYIMPPLILIFIYKKSILKDNYKNLFLIRLMILQIPFQWLGYLVRYMDRLSLYASISQIILMPILIKCTSKDNSQILKFIIIFWYIFYYCVVYIGLNGNGVYPYQYVIGL